MSSGNKSSEHPERQVADPVGLTFDFGYEFPGGGEDLHRVEERVRIDDLPQDA